MGMRLHGNYLVNVFYLSSIDNFDYSYNSYRYRYHLIINNDNILLKVSSKSIRLQNIHL